MITHARRLQACASCRSSIPPASSVARAGHGRWATYQQRDFILMTDMFYQYAAALVDAMLPLPLKLAHDASLLPSLQHIRESSPASFISISRYSYFLASPISQYFRIVDGARMPFLFSRRADYRRHTAQISPKSAARHRKARHRADSPHPLDARHALIIFMTASSQTFISLLFTFAIFLDTHYLWNAVPSPALLPRHIESSFDMAASRPGTTAFPA